MPPDFATSIASRVGTVMKERGLTQERVGDAIGIGQVAVSRRVRGVAPWRAHELVALSAAFDVPLHELYSVPLEPSA